MPAVLPPEALKPLPHPVGDQVAPQQDGLTASFPIELLGGQDAGHALVALDLADTGGLLGGIGAVDPHMGQTGVQDIPDGEITAGDEDHAADIAVVDGPQDIRQGLLPVAQAGADGLDAKLGNSR